MFDSLHSLSHPGIHAIRNLSPPDLFGRVSMPMSVVGLAHVSHVNVPRSTNTLLLHFPHFPSPTPTLMSTSTWSDHFHPLRVILTFLPVWIDTPAGLKHSPSETLQRTPLPRPSSQDGSLIWRSLYHCYRSWTAIRIYPLVSAHVTSRYETISHNCLPPSIQWHG